MKYTKFRDIPQFTRNGNWESNFGLVYLIQFIDEEIEKHGLNLEPDFQRNHVWTKEQQIAYLEYFLRGGKSGLVVYLNNPSWNYSVKPEAYNEYVCVDGLQRLTAIRNFINNEIKVFGSYYSEYEDTTRFTQTLRVNINDLQTKEEVLQWYLDMNAGGTPHTNNEIDKVRKMLDEENLNHFNDTEEDQIR